MSDERAAGAASASLGPEGLQMMLRAIRSFTYIDPVLGPQEVIGEEKRYTLIAPDHWLANAFPDAWIVADEPMRVLECIPHTTGRSDA